MVQKRKLITVMCIAAGTFTTFSQDYFDDVYYNPKKDTSTDITQNKSRNTSTYISDFGNMDVDAYNRRGSQYYVSGIDTIGTKVENGEDFVYTQQIQKYYNPTIVVENANSLGDILSNAYGNVDIIINDNGYPVFGPWYGYSWPYYYSSLWSPWSWGFNFGPLSWSIGWNYPWYSWNWGPGWGSAWGSAWGWSPGWGPSWGPGPGPMASWSPRGNRPVGPRPGWAGATRPGAPMAMHRPASNYRGNPGHSGNPGISRPGAPMQSATRPAGVVNNGGRWEYNTNINHRSPGTGILNSKNPQGSTIGNRTPSNNGNKNTGNVNNNKNTNTQTTHRTPTNNRTTNNRTTVTNNRNTGSFGGGHSSGGRSTGGRGGGGGGRHR